MGKKRLGTLLAAHFQENFTLYIISILFVFTGVVIGVYSVKYMGAIEKSDLMSYLSSFSELFNSNKFSYKDIFFQAIKNNIPLLVGIWFLGLTMVGTPIILILDIIKGYTVGFTVSFLIKGMGAKGLIMALLAVFPQNIVYIPCIVFSSVAAMEFSIMLLKKNSYKSFMSSMFAKISTYSGVFLIICLVMFLGFFIEAFGTPLLMKLIVFEQGCRYLC